MADLVLEDDRMCFACGSKNPIGLKLKFSLDDNNTLHTEFIPEKVHQGYKNVVHGGIIALILDKVMVNLLWKLGRPVVSAQIEVKLLQPASPGEVLHFEACISEDKEKVVYTMAKATRQDRTLIASATAKCIEV